MPKPQPVRVVDRSNAPRWIEYMVDFVDPGFYVSDWKIKVNYTSEREQTKLSIQYDGVPVSEEWVLTSGGKAVQTISVPKPDYEMATRLRLIHEAGVTIESIDVIWPKDDSITTYREFHDKK